MTYKPNPDVQRLHVEAERSLFDAIQEANAITLNTPMGEETQSIAAKACARLGIGEGQVARLSVGTGVIKAEDSDLIGERLWVVAEVTEGKGTKVTQTPIGKIYENGVGAEEDYTFEEVLAVGGMVKGLQELQKTGVLSYLHPSMGYIYDPNATMMRLPPVRKQP